MRVLLKYLAGGLLPSFFSKKKPPTLLKVGLLKQPHAPHCLTKTHLKQKDPLLILSTSYESVGIRTKLAVQTQ